MNILLLTPDAVGGTFLMRLLTIYMQMHELDKPVIDVGHVELGLETYYSPELNQEILKSKHDRDYREMQTLSEIQDMLEKVKHYKVIKLPYYNILGRQDPIKDQVPFYHYLNENYFIISCLRENLFEHALSWALNKITNTLNVYSVDEKIRNFAEFYQYGVNIDPLSVKQSLNSYKQYVDWTEKNFRISSYYIYEKHMPAIEKYILSLPIFAGQKKLVTWKDTFGQELNDWNKCHYYLSDIGSLALTHSNVLQEQLTLDVKKHSNRTEVIASDINHSWHEFLNAYNRVADPSWPAIETMHDWEMLSPQIKHECITIHDIGYHLESIQINNNILTHQYGQMNFSVTNTEQIKNNVVNYHRDFLSTELQNYQTANREIQKLHDLGILSNTVPIKKQTLAEKKLMIKNFSDCLAIYNDWINKNPEFGCATTEEELLKLSHSENLHWAHNSNQLSIGNN